MSYLDLTKKTFLITLVSSLTLVSLFVFYQSYVIFLSALVGVGISSLISPFINQFEKKYRVPRFVGALVLILFIFFIFMILFMAAGSIVFEQFEGVKENLPKIIEKWQSYITESIDDYPKIGSLIMEQSSSSGMTDSIFSYAALTVSGLVTSITGVSLAAVIALFTSINSKKYYKFFTENIPKKIIDESTDRIDLSNQILRKWFSAQLLDMLLVALITTSALWVAGIKYWALFGIMSGVFSIIPFVGIIAVVLFSGVVIAVTQPDKIFLLFLIFFITQQLEGNFILPKLMKDHVQIPAAPLVFLMVLMGTWFGLLGVLVTPPILAIAVAQYKYSQGDI